jgi:outer membrane protein assembly factor BamB
VYALRVENGEKVAVFDLESPVSSSPVLVAGKVLVAVEAGQVYSLDAGAGQKKPLANLEDKVFAPLAASDGVIYIHSAKDVLHAVDARSGATLWSLEVESE